MVTERAVLGPRDRPTHSVWTPENAGREGQGAATSSSFSRSFRIWPHIQDRSEIKGGGGGSRFRRKGGENRLRVEEEEKEIRSEQGRI